MTTLNVPDSPKMLRETLCFAQAAVAGARSNIDESRRLAHLDRLGRMIYECERHRPLDSDGKHGDNHTPTCGCEDNLQAAPADKTWLETE